jgi:predicted ferric reductase
VTTVGVAPGRQGGRIPPALPSWRPAVVSALWLTVFGTVALWLHGGGLRGLSGGPAPALTALGRGLGLAAAYLLLVQVVLMARIPALERSWGQDVLARWHRWVGFSSYNLVLAHIATITLGYALTDRTNPVREAWTLLTQYGGMLLAFAGTAALTVVTVTSVRVARRRLRYESWHLLHLYAYLGIGLAVPHQIWTGGDLAASPLAKAWWLAMYAVAAGALVVHRVAVPLLRSARHGIRVAKVVPEGDGVVSVHLTGRGLHRLRAQAGQFFIWRFVDGPGWTRGNPYSLSAAPGHLGLRITAKDLGDGSRRLGDLEPGTRVLIEGPYGRLTAERRTKQRVAFLACGIGITPLRALLEEMSYGPGEAVLVYRARHAGDLVLREEIEQIARRRGVEVHYVTGPRDPRGRSWLPRGSGRTDDARVLAQLVPHLKNRDVYVCGPEAWMAAVARAARRAGLPDDQLHAERFAW